MGYDRYLEQVIRTVQDFPKKGICYYDITSILLDPKAFSHCIEAMVSLYKDRDLKGVAAVEARGFLFAAPFAEKLGIPLILIRKKGKLPGETIEREFALEYGTDTIQIHKHDIVPGDSLVIVDDLIATGGTIKAAVDLLTESGAIVEDVFSVIGLPFLGFRELLAGVEVKTLQDYAHE